ncbi:uncharacterized protein BDR25DRAFT_328648 [Lindgomyces ingoldianus]|uniref:Uncharacterized protein n=1 Tax=Lindgomyces ingoldianus TaxID=673940 RepID=A0ACB6QGH5_9PLEO|nr:uncharacterized protein BDR25DRAFT_328648 [Lindgomyces ingoldianus]KAF2465610.1 hypothetical protein BDR25DRAFT_328648 [Lindgomyces ingoldianus]
MIFSTSLSIFKSPHLSTPRGIFDGYILDPRSNKVIVTSLLSQFERVSSFSYQGYVGALKYSNDIIQKIDHLPHKSQYEPHVKGTFKQRYFFDSSYYKLGGPVFLYIGGETSGDSRFSNLQTGIIQILMVEDFNGMDVILENRYYGKSFPFNSSTTDELRYLTTEETIADNSYFAQNPTFPSINDTLNAPTTPWIMYGGSLAGAQTAFTMKVYNSIFAGGIRSSATAQALLSYPYYKIDDLINSGDEDGTQEAKEIFGLEALESSGDFAITIAFPIGGPMFYPTNTWQELNWSPRYGSEDFFYFYSNYSDGDAWTSLGGYADYVKKTLIPDCESGRITSTDEGCFGAQNQTYWGDASNGGGRSYLYSSRSDADKSSLLGTRSLSSRSHSRSVPNISNPSSGIKNVSAEPNYIREAHRWEINAV